MSGGAAMNSVFNGKLDKNKSYKNSYIGHAPDDSGVSIDPHYIFIIIFLIKKELTKKKSKLIT